MDDTGRVKLQWAAKVVWRQKKIENKKRTECNRSFFLGNAPDNVVTRERVRYSSGMSQGRRIYELINIVSCKIRNATRLLRPLPFPRRRRCTRGHGLHGGNPMLRFASNTVSDGPMVLRISSAKKKITNT